MLKSLKACYMNRADTQQDRHDDGSEEENTSGDEKKQEPKVNNKSNFILYILAMKAKHQRKPATDSAQEIPISIVVSSYNRS